MYCVAIRGAMMNNSNLDQGGENQSNRNHLSLDERGVTETDLALAAQIPASGCPRRYCWWWVSALFEWNLSPSEGCTLLQAKKPPRFKYGNIPCCRSELSSPIDHFEPREPFIRLYRE